MPSTYFYESCWKKQTYAGPPYIETALSTLPALKKDKGDEQHFSSSAEFPPKSP